MSPTEPPTPERAGSVRHFACFWPSRSIGLVSQSWMYSAWMSRMLAQFAARHHLAGLARHRVAGVVVRERERPFRISQQVQASFLASLRLAGQRLVADDVDAALQECLATGKCMWLGVTMATASMPSRSRDSRRAISSNEP
jgi:hypothetical protein